MPFRPSRGSARTGSVATPHGEFRTPCFMPIATVGAVKTLSCDEVRALGATILLANTYHLLLRPGVDDLCKVDGLHKLMRYDGPLLTDSGGYQVFSLANINRTDEDGVTFRSHLSGESIRLTPEISIDVQRAIGADIFMQFDDVAAGDASYERCEEAMERSLRWARRSKDAFVNTPPYQGGVGGGLRARPLLFGIVQGGTHEDLRERSVDGLVTIGFDGYAIGGLSVGEKREDMFRMTKLVTSLLPADRPRYFMGGGMPEEIVVNVAAGVDMFDCVLPTRNARHGSIFVWADDPAAAVRRAFDIAQNGGTDREIARVLYEKIHIENEQFATDMTPIDALNDGAPTSQTYSRAYLRHLLRTGEMLGSRLATIQNLRFYLRMMEELRALLV